ncbi:hypothetical protein Acy02nite_68700 [Actinoplanes cyaneus]|uniref:Uncharacterized protein n=1 Tax=Actinoplanes cyaneus TaxID=52696 RepID=A0A919MAV9_9ACTN|nr:hypothetical protein [Actinoplanes cyaneus]MCW2139081.1 hypothetical protein [Actinoplanes cyaneus]GID68989.1 hypothetical protein Acy02nite_68700 [Actinoplanes cyaneus]
MDDTTTSPPRLTKQVRVYLAAPTARHRAQHEFSCAFYAELGFRGFDVVTPAGTLGWSSKSTDEMLAALDKDLNALANCDCLVVMPGGERLAEVTLARSLGIPVFTAEELVSTLPD